MMSSSANDRDVDVVDVVDEEEGEGRVWIVEYG